MKIIKKIIENKGNTFQSCHVGGNFRLDERPTSDIFVKITLPIPGYEYNALNLETCELYSFREDHRIYLCSLEIKEI